jgi:peptidyl-prolyl cis-trans isomerase SurA
MKLYPVLLLSLVGLSFASPELVESVVAVVDGKVILRSEVLASMQQFQSTPGFSRLDAKVQQEKVLQSMIDEKVILARSDRDSIFVDDAEVRPRVDQHIQMLMTRQKVDIKNLEKAIRAQTGLSMSQYRDQLTSQMKEQMLMARIRQRHVGPITPTKAEVEAFYKQYKDSLPLQYNSILVSHIQLKIEPNQAIVDSVRKLSAKIVDSLDQGIMWDVLAARHSQDSMAKKGGDLGYFRKGLLEPEYERAAWKLNLGQYLDAPVKTRFGWHLIRILGKKNDEVRTAQILLRTIPSFNDTVAASIRIDSLRKVAMGGASFADLARKWSQDAETAWKGGSLGWMERTELDSMYQQVIANLSSGEVSDPVKIDGDWHIFRLDESLPTRALTLADDFAKIEEYAINNMGNAKLQTLVARWRKEIFIEVRLGKE